MRRYFLQILILVLLTGCGVSKHKNILYLKKAEKSEQPGLNIFSPKNKNSLVKSPVLIFVHGGNWDSGKKEMYSFFGKNFAKKGITTVVVGYTLSPQADYKEMTSQIASAIQWTKNNIEHYNGDPNKLFLTGHSAGGHLISLAVMNPEYNIDTNDISGIILNDAAGLDMHHYLQQNPPSTTNNYLTTWTNNPENWKKASPVFYLDENTPPFLIYLGKKTYPSIITANKRFLKALQQYQPKVAPVLINKKHIPMMTQYIWPWSNRYKEIINFMEANSK
ncbi:alpha/beta hydrolase [Gramella sp. MAR_2010_147]|uniref:alpha/beta hydrolase n=1 Tax=Gramella sp. MAR_2010_147 TaxID=1250205 RepID=UPI00087ACC40|nr:alpha/beta hydrolase [Gramella sp. MAR_2010_147]SDS63575.1 Carboxylesterase family protein [Gramella sp. MAR_2010_147]